ncbi:serine/threonine-protein phosphatase 2A regulatory subunit B'' subunit delta isoform X5 [Mus musculus]|uniref:serine/threonine-protein phosphatase 2A regulatory subunit B'' subunit delta isoform X5 n=1 Tax=Mus musculus TaxID=10090 RepID=UPI00167B44A7|nr:serine/threonine-protein phosphatase 2A regulatory subunit B'' subunit delta isoform X5 [Mus musculus]
MPERPPIRALRRDPDDPAVRQALASLARGSDLVFPSRFQKWLRDFRQVGGVSDGRRGPCPQEGGAPAPVPTPWPQRPRLLLPLRSTPAPSPGHGGCHRPRGVRVRGAASWEGGSGRHGRGCQGLWLPSVLEGPAVLRCGRRAHRLCIRAHVRSYVAQDVVNSHPGLAFLRAAKDFHSRYITTVIQRIFYTVNRSWSGMISREELRRSSFLQAVSQLEVEPDINRMTSFFSYEHFYVIYCKFWELDLDRDLTIDRSDLARHGDGAISSRMIDRIFSGAVTRARLPRKVGKLSYADFVWFLLSEEDKTTPTSTEYWFRCMDLDGDGALSMFELEFFYEEQAQRMAARGVEPLPFHDLARQVLDLVAPRCPGRITLRDLKQCGLAGEFFDAFFNVDKYLAREQREQAGTPQDTDSDPAASAWDRYAAEEYDFLVAEEAMAEDDDDHDEGPCPL